MDNLESVKSSLFDCPICLQTLLQPITLTCGHSFCQPCLRNKYFYQFHSQCPICRSPLYLSLRVFKVNILLETLIQQNCCTEQYTQRLEQHHRVMQQDANRRHLSLFWRILYNRGKSLWLIMQKMLPIYIIVMAILIYMTVKQNFFNQRIRKMEKQLSEEALKLAHLLRTDTTDTRDIDIQNLVFSKIVKYLFTNCVRF